MKDLTNQMDSIRTDSNLTKCRETDPREVNLCGVSKLDGVSKSNLKENFCVILHSFLMDVWEGSQRWFRQAWRRREARAFFENKNKLLAFYSSFYLQFPAGENSCLLGGEEKWREWNGRQTAHQARRLD